MAKVIPDESFVCFLFSYLLEEIIVVTHDIMIIQSPGFTDIF